MDKFKFNLGKFSGTSDEILRNMKEQAVGSHKLSFDELFPPDFMGKHSQYKTIQDLIADCGFPPDSPDWEEHIIKTTDFKSWKEMITAAHLPLIRNDMGIN